MLIARYWAEYRATGPNRRGREIGMRRWGWSNVSQSDAEAMARQRAETAVAQARISGAARWQEANRAYLAADGLPIREEILEEYPDTRAVLTRNAYGAHCLNVADVLFADVDDPDPPATYTSAMRGTWFVILWVSFVLLLVFKSHVLTAIGLIGAICANIALVVLWLKEYRHKKAQRALTEIERHDPSTISARLSSWLAQHPQWRLHLYRTPAGWRIIADHARCVPDSSLVQDFFKHINGDPLYAELCRRQQCFRARVTAKPWRIGMRQHLPRDKWPIHDSTKLDRRQRWCMEYERHAAEASACRFIASFGDAPADAHAEQVRSLHDQLSRAHSDKPLA